MLAPFKTLPTGERFCLVGDLLTVEGDGIRGEARVDVLISDPPRYRLRQHEGSDEEPAQALVDERKLAAALDE